MALHHLRDFSGAVRAQVFTSAPRLLPGPVFLFPFATNRADGETLRSVLTFPLKMHKIVYSRFFSTLFWLLVYISSKGGYLHISSGCPGDRDTVQPASLPSPLLMEISGDGISRKQNCRTNQGDIAFLSLI